MEIKTYQGYWYLPENCENKIAGTLKISSENEIELEILGILVGNEEFAVFSKVPIILGITSDSSKITLENCNEAGYTIAGFNTQRFQPEVAYVGCHFFEKENLLFPKLQLEFTNLDKWLNISGFDYKIVERRFEVSYTSPDNIYAEIPGAKLAIGFHFIPKRGYTECTLKQISKVEIIPDKHLTIQKFNDYIFTITEFLEFATNGACYPINIEVFSPDRIKVFCSLARKEKKKTESKLFFFSFKYIEDNFSDILTKWFEAREDLRGIIDLYFGINNSFYLEQKFLSIVMVVESYHRMKYTNAEQSNVCERWTKKNKPYLSSRLRELINSEFDIIAPLIDNKERLINKIVKARNRMVHIDTNQPEPVTPKELFNITQILILLMKIKILREMSFTEKNISMCVKKALKRIKLIKFE